MAGLTARVDHVRYLRFLSAGLGHTSTTSPVTKLTHRVLTLGRFKSVEAHDRARLTVRGRCTRRSRRVEVLVNRVRATRDRNARWRRGPLPQGTRRNASRGCEVVLLSAFDLASRT